LVHHVVVVNRGLCGVYTSAHQGAITFVNLIPYIIEPVYISPGELCGL